MDVFNEMGSLESNLPTTHVRSSPFRHTIITRVRSRLARLLFFTKIDFFKLICVFGVLFFSIFLCQMFFVPGSVSDFERTSDRIRALFHKQGSMHGLPFFDEVDFGEDLKIGPSRVMEMVKRNRVNESSSSRKVTRYDYTNPRLALVFGDMWVDPHQILMYTVAVALQECGYQIEAFSLEDGPMQDIWVEHDINVNVVTADEGMNFSVDWLNYHGILVNSLKALEFMYSLMQNPFKSVPVIWTIHEQTLAVLLKQYVMKGQTELVENWRTIFDRATAVVFPNYILTVAYAVCDPGNYFVIPGSPAEAWKAENMIPSYKYSKLAKIEFEPDAYAIAIVGSQLLHRGVWLEHALILKALHPLIKDFARLNSRLKIFIFAGVSTSNYSRVVETIATKLNYPNGTVKHIAVDIDDDATMRNVDIVIYGSFSEEDTFPDILQKAMSCGVPVIAPNLAMITKYISDRVNGFLFPKDNLEVLTKIVSQILPSGDLSLLANNAASFGKDTARNMMVTEVVKGYASLLEYIISPPSEVMLPNAVGNFTEWPWRSFETVTDVSSLNKTEKILESIFRVEREFVSAPEELGPMNDTFLYEFWEEQKNEEEAAEVKRIEDKLLMDRSDQPRLVYDEVYRKVKRADRFKVRERDEGELLRTGQPLTIYEPYFGEGTWPFLHNTSLYRGISLSRKGRRHEFDDINGPSRLSLLDNEYYRDVLEEFGAFFAIANRIDNVHKNAWIGFQPWRVTAAGGNLSEDAEAELLDAIEAKTHGDTLYFWSSLLEDPRSNSGEEFWSFCDAMNAGNCQLAFIEALERMYGARHYVNSVPSMPSGGGTWSTMNCWALPTRSFLEFVMFSRMFVDALDAQFYGEHNRTGHCYLNISKDKHCYSRLLELLVNVWAYHSARRIVYVDHWNGSMQEQHELSGRRGKMWIKWFEFSTLKSMDEDLAEEFDDEHPKRRWLWPSTGEVLWHGMYVREKNLRTQEREKRKQQMKVKIQRMRRRYKQKVLGKLYVEEETNSSDVVQVRLLMLDW